MENVIKNVVFDVGDVLVDFRYMDYMRKDLGFSEECTEFLAKNMVVTNFWHELDLGIRTNAEGLATFTEKYPQYRDEITAFWTHLDGIVSEYDYAPGLIQSIKDKGYGVYILSNYPIETAEMHWPKFKFLPITDGHIISGYEKVTKPDEPIFRLLETRFGIKLEECIFVDDRKVNTDAAEKYGMKSILFTSYEQLLKELADMGIEL